jgi:hypothetical protein
MRRRWCLRLLYLLGMFVSFGVERDLANRFGIDAPLGSFMVAAGALPAIGALKQFDAANLVGGIRAGGG